MKASDSKASKLLKNKQVLDEIDKHKWIESEKAGYDIGFEKAVSDWLDRYAEQWERTHRSPNTKKVRKVRKVKKGYREPT